jgi:hypothetical protein
MSGAVAGGVGALAGRGLVAAGQVHGEIGPISGRPVRFCYPL